MVVSAERSLAMKAVIEKVIWVPKSKCMRKTREKRRVMAANLLDYCVFYKSMVEAKTNWLHGAAIAHVVDGLYGDSNAPLLVVERKDRWGVAFHGGEVEVRITYYVFQKNMCICSR